MKIERVIIDGIPPFRKIDLRLPYGLCIIVDKNETGKSTIARAILESLYNPKNGGLKERGDGTIILEFNINKDYYIIENSLSAGKYSRKIRENGRDLPRKTKDPGELLFGLTYDEFTKTAFVDQHKLAELDQPESIGRHLERIIDSSSQTTANEALQRLDEALNKKFSLPEILKEGKITTAIDRLNNEIKKKLSTVKTLKEKIQREKNIIDTYERLKKEKDELEEKQNLLKIHEKFLKLNEQEGILKRLKEIELEIKSHEKYKNFPYERFEKINKTHGRLEERKNENKKMKEESSGLIMEMERLSQELKDLPELYSLDTETIQKLINELKTLEVLYKEAEKFEEKLEGKRGRFKWNLKRHIEIHRIVENLTPIEKRAIGDYKNKREEINSKIAELTGTLELRMSILKRVRLLFIGLFITGCMSLYIMRDILGLIPSISALLIILLLSYAIYRIRAKRLYLSIREIKDNLEDRRSELKSLEREYENFKNTYNLTYEEYSEYQAAISDLFEIIRLEDELNKNKRAISQKMDWVSSILRRDLNPSIIIEVIKRCEKGYAMKRTITDIEKKMDELQEKIDEKDKEIKKDIEILMEFSRIAGIPFNEDNIDEFIEMCSIAKKSRETYERLISEKEKLAKMRYEDNYIERLKDELKGHEDLTSKIEKRTLQEIQEESERISEKIRALNDSLEKLRIDYHNISKDRDELIRLEEDISMKKVLREKTMSYMESLTIAKDTIMRISSEHHREWSEILNNRVKEILGKITSRSYTIRFNNDLSFVFIFDDIQINNKEMQHILSGGITEQIYLSIRMAICDYISKDVRLPLILDEPFAHSDDERFMNGMEFLINEFSRSRQVIVLSCHELRHRALKERYRDINIMNITSLAGP